MMKNLDILDLFIGFVIGLLFLLFVGGIIGEVYLYFHCWGLPLNNELPYECFNRGFYSVINNN